MSQITNDRHFHTTLWSMVLQAGGAEGSRKHAALDELCRLYWKPLFVYCLNKGRKIEDAEDLTQAFFEHLLARDTLRVVDPARGRFRGFLLTSFKHFISDQGDRASAARRGSGAVHLSFDIDFAEINALSPSMELTPEQAFDRQWAFDLIDRATASLRSEYRAAGKEQWYELAVGSQAGASYAEVAAELGSTEEAVKSFVKRARRRFREALEREIADTVGSPDEAAEEMGYLIELLRA